MFKQYKRTRITQSGKITPSIAQTPGRAHDFKSKDLIGHLWVSLIIEQSKCWVCFLFLYWISSFLHCFKKTALLLTNQNGKLFSCILLIQKNQGRWRDSLARSCLPLQPVKTRVLWIDFFFPRSINMPSSSWVMNATKTAMSEMILRNRIFVGCQEWI